MSLVIEFKGANENSSHSGYLKISQNKLSFQLIPITDNKADREVTRSRCLRLGQLLEDGLAGSLDNKLICRDYDDFEITYRFENDVDLPLIEDFFSRLDANVFAEFISQESRQTILEGCQTYCSSAPQKEIGHPAKSLADLFALLQSLSTLSKQNLGWLLALTMPALEKEDLNEVQQEMKRMCLEEKFKVKLGPHSIFAIPPAPPPTPQVSKAASSSRFSPAPGNSGNS